MLLSVASYADDTTDINNKQVLLGDPFLSFLNVTVGDVDTVAGQADALGNTLSVDYTTGSVNVTNDQSVSTSGQAESVVNVDIATQGASSNATAIANSATITTCCGNITSDSTQFVGAGIEIGAVSNLNVTNWAMNPSTSALAVGNAISTQTWYGTSLTSIIDQKNQAGIKSEAFIDGGGLLADSATVVSTAIANTGFAGGEQTTTIVDVDQFSHGPIVQALGGVNSPNVEDVFVATTATGNNFSIENSFGFVQSDVYQEQAAYVRAQTDVSVGNWENNNAATSYAVGNSNLTSNIGSDIFLTNVQLNVGGGVEAVTNYAGGSSGGVGGADTQLVSSAAIGNAVSGYLCGNCGGGITASNTQTNSATVTSTTNITSGNGGTIVGTASAVGNSATYHSTTGD
jgi:hypothetical protein